MPANLRLFPLWLALAALLYLVREAPIATNFRSLGVGRLSSLGMCKLGSSCSLQGLA